MYTFPMPEEKVAAICFVVGIGGLFAVIGGVKFLDWLFKDSWDTLRRVNAVNKSAIDPVTGKPWVIDK